METNDHMISYFTNFRGNSESSAVTGSRSVSESRKSTDHIDPGDRSASGGPEERIPSQSEDSAISKLCYIPNLSPIISDDEALTKTPYNELTLSEIGFKSTKIDDWDKIIQLTKPDLLELLDNMIKKHIKTNVQIKIGSTIFNCHMMVLQCYSEFFMSLGNEQIVGLPEDKVTPQAFRMVYEWMLAKKPVVQREGILELFNAAQFLKIRALVDQCWMCFDDDERFCEDAAFILYLEARNYGHALIQQVMLTRICRFFLTLVASKDFLNLQPEEICTLLESNSIAVNTENDVLMAAVRWINYDWEERKVHLTKVIRCVRFGLMAPVQLVELRRVTDSVEVQRIVNHPEVHKMIDDGLSYATATFFYAQNPENVFNYMERLKISEPMERQWIRDEAWHKHFSGPYNTYTAFLQYLERIREIGKEHWKTLQYSDQNPNTGYVNFLVANGLDIFDRAMPKKKRTKIVKMTLKGALIPDQKAIPTEVHNRTASPRSQVNESVRNEEKQLHEELLDFGLFMKNTSYKIFLFGGTDPYNIDASDTMKDNSKDVFTYKPAHNTWSCVSSMPGARQHHSAIFCQGKIYVIGGSRIGCKNITTGLAKTMWSFDIENLEWRNEKKMIYSRRDFGLVADKLGLYVLGGEDAEQVILSSVHFYSFETSEWSESVPMRVPRAGLCAASKENEIWIAGGIMNHAEDIMVSNTFECFNRSTGKWTAEGNLRTPKAYARMCFINSKQLYIFGGICRNDKKMYSTASVDVYDDQAKQWKKVASMENARHGHDLAVLGDKVLIVGGVSFGKKQTWDSAECYDATNNRWLHQVPELPFKLSGLACASAQKAIN